MALTVDTRTATEYGVVRTFGQADFTYSTRVTAAVCRTRTTTTGNILTGNTQNNYAGNGVLGVEYAFIQFAGFTFGKSASAYVTPWQGFPGNNTSYLVGGYDTITGINNVQYTAQFGNGVSASIGLDDSSANDYNRTQIVNASVAGSANLNTGAQPLQTWCRARQTRLPAPSRFTAPPARTVPTSAPLTAARSCLTSSVTSGSIRPGASSRCRALCTTSIPATGPRPIRSPAVTSWAASAQTGTQNLGHPDSKAGGAVQVALQFKNLPTGAGDDFKIEGSWSLGASKYVLGNLGPVGRLLLFVRQWTDWNRG